MNWDCLEKCEELVRSTDLGGMFSVFFVDQCGEPAKSQPGEHPYPVVSAAFQGTVQSIERMESQVKSSLKHQGGAE